VTNLPAPRAPSGRRTCGGQNAIDTSFEEDIDQ